MEPDIDALYERHFERFLDKCQESCELRIAVYKAFADPEEQFLAWKQDVEDIEVYEVAFDVMYGWEPEYFICSPLEAIEDYMRAKKEIQKCLTR